MYNGKQKALNHKPVVDIKVGLHFKVQMFIWNTRTFVIMHNIFFLCENGVKAQPVTYQSFLNMVTSSSKIWAMFVMLKTFDLDLVTSLPFLPVNIKHATTNS